MILTCPSCETRYATDENAVGRDGRRVRCASCGHSWFARLADDSETVLTENVGGLTREQVERLRLAAHGGAGARQGPHAEFRAREHARRRRERRMAIAGVWGSFTAIVTAVVALAVVFRNDIAAASPPTATAFRLAGIEANRFGLDFADVDAKRSFDGTTPVILVSGQAVNRGRTARPAPDIRISLLDEGGLTLQVVTDALAEGEIPPGEAATFAYRITAPPLETYGLALSFADQAAAETDPPAGEGGGAEP